MLAVLFLILFCSVSVTVSSQTAFCQNVFTSMQAVLEPGTNVVTQEASTVSIYGEVAHPGTFPFIKGMTIQDLIAKSGGLTEFTSITKIEVARLIREPDRLEASSVIAKIFTIEFKNGNISNKGINSFLEPYDRVFVRKTSDSRQHERVVVGGEVAFPGTYMLFEKARRLSDLVKQSGGVASDAYVKGARLLRRMSKEELKQKKGVVNLDDKEIRAGSISLAAIDLNCIYTIGLDLDKALEYPGSDYDMLLREGDMLFVPKFVNTVQISGEVMYPNTVLYEAGAKLSHYVDQAGGWGHGAKKRSVYVVYLNGTVSRLCSKYSKGIEPGCEIIIPSKDENKREIEKYIATTVSINSLAMIVASMAHLMK